MISKRLMKKRESTNKLMTEMNVVPYIDVMLVLLIIFMVSAPLIQHTIEVDLPQTTNDPESTSRDDGHNMVLTIDSDGHFYIDTSTEPVSLDDLALEVLAYNQLYSGEFNVFIRGDRLTSYENVVVLMNTLKSHGVDNVNLMTDIVSQ